ncbi:adenylate/guanylate cyclase domain-containing protein, partial [Rhodococcus gannanensis]
DGHALAYQTVGDSPVTVAWFFEIMMHPDLMWTDPHLHYNIERGTTYSRSLFFQRRGFGLSDPVTSSPTLEEQADDVLAVLDDAGAAQAVLVGACSTCGPLTLLAARYPERVAGLVLAEPWCDALVDDDGTVAAGWTTSQRTRFVNSFRAAYAHWGAGELAALTHPTLDRPHNRRIMALLERCSTTPATAVDHLEWALRSEYAWVLPSVQCRTEVVHQPGALFPDDAVRRVADLVPQGRCHELPPILPGTTLGEALIPVLDHVEELATGHTRPVDADRFLATVLFTDVVRSTDVLARLGDSGFATLLTAHDRLVRGEVESGGGTLVGIAGDGTLSLFDGPTAALRCAHRIHSATADLGISVRSGVHTGPVARAGPELTGMTVHVGARIAASADPDEVRCSQMARDLAHGADLAFIDLGTHALRGVPERTHLFATTNRTRPRLPPEPPRPTRMDRAVLTAARRFPGVMRGLARMTRPGNRNPHLPRRRLPG